MIFLGPADRTRRERLVVAPLAVLMGFASNGSLTLPSTARHSIVVPLPVLPPPHVRHPGLFDETGCALLAVGDERRARVCPDPSSKDGANGSKAEPPGAWRRLMGFEGPHYSTSVADRGVEILPSTVRFGDESEWSAVGLLRNDTSSVVDDISVSARLLAEDGRTLDTATFIVPVRSVRPGEPVPFSLTCAIPRADVAAVLWTLNYRPSDQATATGRLVEFEPVRILSARNLPAEVANEASAIADARRSASGPEQLAWGVLKNWSSVPIRAPLVVGMWVDDDGRAVSLVRGRVWKQSDGRAIAPSTLRPGEFGQFALAVPADRSATRPQHRLRLALWETPS